jgi:RNA polymerase sigma-70 factor (ECF subfamily)
MVDEHNGFVARTLQRAGVPPSDLDDEVQRTFIIVAGRLDDVQVGSERSFLYRVALNTAAHLRRTKARRREVTDGRVPEVIESWLTPEHLTSRKETAQLLEEAAASMGEPLHQVFTLFAYEGANLPEIARRLGIPGAPCLRACAARANTSGSTPP